jgi:hypothetical protein
MAELEGGSSCAHVFEFGEGGRRGSDRGKCGSSSRIRVADHPPQWMILENVQQGVNDGEYGVELKESTELRRNEG